MGKGKDRVSASQRWAIWTVYAMKCFWCKHPVDFSECTIDHVIPKSTSKLVLKSMLKDLQLGPDFSTDDTANLVPACVPCCKRREKGANRQSSLFPSWFDVVRKKLPLIEGKVRQIEGDQSVESLLKSLLEKLERGEVTHEVAERIAGPLLRSLEGAKEGNSQRTIEFRLSKKVHLLFEGDSVRLRPEAEIRYEKFVDGMVEGGEWKRKSVERLNEGPSFGEGRRRPGSGA